MLIIISKIKALILMCVLCKAWCPDSSLHFKAWLLSASAVSIAFELELEWSVIQCDNLEKKLLGESILT